MLPLWQTLSLKQLANVVLFTTKIKKKSIGWINYQLKLTKNIERLGKKYYWELN